MATNTVFDPLLPLPRRSAFLVPTAMRPPTTTLSSSPKMLRLTHSLIPLSTSNRCLKILCKLQSTTAFAASKRNMIAAICSICIASHIPVQNIAFAQPSVGFREYIDTFDGYSFKYPQNWIQVRGAGADIFFRDPFVLDENLSVDISSPSSSSYKSIEDLGPPQEAGKKILKQYLIEFMSTRLGVRRESNILSTSSRVADDGKLYYQVEVNIKSYANNNELAVMPQDRIARLEWDRRYLSVLGVENNRLYELRLQTPEKVFQEEESDIRQVMDSFRVSKITA
ncbi:PsbP domain-containing protein 1, chloroplastic [Ancistrocladus abbreviatus]